MANAIASHAAGIRFTDGLLLRLALLGIGWLTCVALVMRCAARVKADPARSIVAERREDNARHFLGKGPNVAADLTVAQKLVPILSGLTFAVMIWGVALRGWWMAGMSMLFLAASIVITTVAWIGEKPFVEWLVDGARELLGVALIIGLARGIVVIMAALSLAVMC